jgi:hypothetical protein
MSKVELEEPSDLPTVGPTAEPESVLILSRLATPTSQVLGQVVFEAVAVP